MAGVRGKELSFGIGVLGLLSLLISGTPSSLFAQFSTSDHISQSGFWPTQTKYPRDEYSGPRSCAGCHLKIVQAQQETSMAHTAMRAGESEILQANPLLGFAQGPYRYQLQSAGGESVYTVSDGRRVQSAPLAWAFGTNRIAQSYLFKKPDSEFYEARVTYFLSLGALDFTPGRALNSANDVDEAMYRQVSRSEVYRCFGCHTTASGIGSTFDEARLIPGVSCEACHGPARDHVDEMEGVPVEKAAVTLHEQNTPARIFNPKTLSPEESVDFCGSCHGSYWDVSLSGSSGVGNARFQPYRLEQSKCWNKSDARLTCIACHDPHQQVQTQASAYDHVCLSCHRTQDAANKDAAIKPAPSRTAQAHHDGTHPGAACPVATAECTSCHMPEVYIPVMHRSFPDHRIRIAREGDLFPD
jgi:hypothetical protein